MSDAFPPARGSRLPWSELGPEVLTALEQHFGGPVAHAEVQPDGFSPAVAAVVTFTNGRKAFVKAASAGANPDSPGMYRAEGELSCRLPPEAHAPKLLWSYDRGAWVALAFEHVVGQAPQLPWTQADLARVLGALSDLADLAVPAGFAPETAARFGPVFGCWRRAVEAGDDAVRALARVDPWAARHLPRLAELEVGWAPASGGAALVHGDIRADNLLLTGSGPVFVDWAHASVGARWLDLLFMLPSVAMQGGPEPSEVFASHPLGVGAPPEGVTAVLCALTGFFLWSSLQPAPPGLPTLRPFQLGQGRAAAAWLQRRTGWP